LFKFGRSALEEVSLLHLNYIVITVHKFAVVIILFHVRKYVILYNLD